MATIAEVEQEARRQMARVKRWRFTKVPPAIEKLIDPFEAWWNVNRADLTEIFYGGIGQVCADDHRPDAALDETVAIIMQAFFLCNFSAFLRSRGLPQPLSTAMATSLIDSGITMVTEDDDD